MGRWATYGATAISALLFGAALGFYGWPAESWRACIVSVTEANRIALADGRWLGATIGGIVLGTIITAVILVDVFRRQAREADARTHHEEIRAQAAEAQLDSVERRARIAEAELEYARERNAAIVVKPPRPSLQPSPGHGCDSSENHGAATIVPRPRKVRKSKGLAAKRRQSKTMIPTMVSGAPKATVPASVRQWFTERIVPQPDHRLKPLSAFEDYRSWCERHGEAPVNQTVFGKVLRDGLAVEKFVTSGGRIFYVDVALRARSALIAVK